ncbi:MAG: sulfate transporter CysZ [Candidatus Endonucleobacter sp. (ex Gigantidas childressi)]|nr:sulfate transporter CysZ [Candidatus Endonucleobacter sp. (ex Gigantidas childressi)]
MNHNTSPSGAFFFIAGFKMMFNPALRWFVFAPLLINVFVLSAIVYWTLQKFSGLMAILVGWLPEWMSFSEYLLWPLFLLGVIVSVFFLFTVIGNLIASPFNAILAEKVQRMEGFTLPDVALKDWLVILPKNIGRELRKIQYYLPKILLLLFLSFIPVINLISPFIWFLFNGWMMAIQYCDYAADNRGLLFTDMMRRLNNNTSVAWSFGATVNVMMLIPFVNLLIIPAAVIGSTLLWERRIEPSPLSINLEVRQK